MVAWGYQDIPGKGIPPEDRSWEERIAVHVDLNASWDNLIHPNLIFTWMIIPCVRDRNVEHQTQHTDNVRMFIGIIDTYTWCNNKNNVTWSE